MPATFPRIMSLLCIGVLEVAVWLVYIGLAHSYFLFRLLVGSDGRTVTHAATGLTRSQFHMNHYVREFVHEYVQVSLNTVNLNSWRTFREMYLMFSSHPVTPLALVPSELSIACTFKFELSSDKLRQ